MNNCTSLFILLVINTNLFGQSAPQQEKQMNPYAKIGGGITLMSVGTLLVAGSVVIHGSQKTGSEDKKAAVYIAAGAGSLLSIVGGITASTHLLKLRKYNERRLSIGFSGTSLIVKL